MNAFDRSAPGGRVRTAKRGEHWYALIIFSFLLMAGSSCTFAPSGSRQEEKAELHPHQDIVANQTQIRLRMRALVVPFSGAVVDSADRILAGTTNRAAHREALLWKIEGVPAIRAALFRPDPYAAVVDIWVLTFQMTDYFESGHGKQALGESAPIAIETCQEMEAQVDAIAASLTKSGDVSNVRKFARQWAEEHPIHHSIGGREALVSREVERNLPESFSIQEAATDTLATLDDLTRRLDLYSSQLFDQARWQAELIAMDLASDYQLEKAMPLAERAIKSAEQATTTVDRLAPAVEQSLNVARDIPKLVTSEREAAVKAMHDEIDRTIQQVHDERVIVLEQVDKEREVAMKQLHDSLSAQATQLASDADQLATRKIDYTMQRVTWLMAVAMIAAGIGGLLGLLFVKRMLVRLRHHE